MRSRLSSMTSPEEIILRIGVRRFAGPTVEAKRERRIDIELCCPRLHCPHLEQLP